MSLDPSLQSENTETQAETEQKNETPGHNIVTISQTRTVVKPLKLMALWLEGET